MSAVEIKNYSVLAFVGLLRDSMHSNKKIKVRTESDLGTKQIFSRIPRVLMTKNWKKYSWIFFTFFEKKNFNLLIPRQPSTENIQHFKRWNLLTVSYFSGSFCPPGSGSTTLQNTVNQHAAQTEEEKGVYWVLAWISCFWWGSPTRTHGSSAPRTLENTAALFLIHFNNLLGAGGWNSSERQMRRRSNTEWTELQCTVLRESLSEDS